MTTPSSPRIDFYNYYPRTSDFRREVLEGLSGPAKTIPPKFFYDQRGSQLFEQITELREYYPTRTEIAILGENAAEIAACIGKDPLLIEFGSGSSRKIRLLLDSVAGRVTYCAIDISKRHLIESTEALARLYPAARVVAICADYTQDFPFPELPLKEAGRRTVFFPGSTVGNFSPEQVEDFMRSTAGLLGPGGGLLIGVDLKKDPQLLRAAYNDKEGVTAAFNLNLLRRMNEELGANFDLEAFRHCAHYNETEGRIEMHLVSLAAQTVRMNGNSFHFAEGETIHTENSYKYSAEEFTALARRFGYRAERIWTDTDELFSLHYLKVQ